MWEILSVLERVGRGESKSSAARATGCDRKTVRRYVAIAVELGWKPGEIVVTEELALQVFRRLRPRRTGLGASEELLEPHTDQIREWLMPRPGEKRGLRLTKVHQLLVRKGIEVPYSSLNRFAQKHCGFSERRRVTVRRADCEPGEAAEIDFGRLGLISDPLSSRRRTVWGLIVTLLYSRHQYLHVTHTQSVKDVINGLEDAWYFFGGVVQRVVLDNLKPSVKKADRYDPVFQRTFEEYARYRGFVSDATVAAHATGKPVVERNVSYVRENFFRGEEWRDIEHVQRQAIAWCLKRAGTRIHGTIRKRPLAVFENEERAKLRPLERERYDPPHWSMCSVHPDHHIMVDKASYSVPSRLLRHKVWARVDSKLVRIYHDGELIKTHPRQPPGGRSTDHEDYPKELTAYTLRDPNRLIRQGAQHDQYIGKFMEQLLSGAFPWAKLRQAQKLLRLGDKYGWRRLAAACRRALAFEVINVYKVERILQQDLEHVHVFAATEGDDEQVIPIESRFQRGAKSFSHRHSNTGGQE